MTAESAADRFKRQSLEKEVAEMARAIIPNLPPGTGFLMVMFDFGARGSMAYAANGNRGDVIKMLDELRGKLLAERS